MSVNRLTSANYSRKGRRKLVAIAIIFAASASGMAWAEPYDGTSATGTVPKPEPMSGQELEDGQSLSNLDVQVGRVESMNPPYDGLAPQPASSSEMEFAPYSDADQAWMASQKRLGDAAWLIENRYGKEFSYAYFGTEDNKTLYVAFKANAPAGARETLEELGLPYVIAENSGYNQEEYFATRDAVVKQLQESLPSETQFTVEPAPQDSPGQIKIRVLGNGEKSIELPIPGVTVEQPFSLLFESDNSVYETTVWGRAAGKWLVDVFGTGQCTSGFVGQRTDGSNDLGLLTAGHCPDGLRYYNPDNGGETYYLDFRAQAFPYNGDAQFNRSPLMMDAWFHVGATTGRPVYGVRNAIANERVCRFGKFTNAERCGTVNGKNLTANTGTALYGNLDSMAGENNFGDSGGSVYGGHTAMGIMSGKANGNTYFTQIGATQQWTQSRVCLEPVCNWP
jgi:hypothetical protein